MPVVTDIDAEFQVRGVEDRPAGIAGLEEELFVKARVDLGDVGLTILAEIGAIGIDDGSGVIVNARHFLFVYRYDDDHLVFSGIFAYQADCVPVGNLLGSRIPLPVLAGAEIGLGEHFLETQHLHALLRGIFDKRDVCLDHLIPDDVRLHRAVAL